jgi:GDP-L-fucose synthase
MIWTLRSYDEADPIILSVGEADEMTIKDVAYGVSRALGIPDEKVKFDTTKADGQYKKTANNAKLMKLNPDFKFTPFNEAIDTTVKWFLENYDKEGGIRK